MTQHSKSPLRYGTSKAYYDTAPLKSVAAWQYFYEILQSSNTNLTPILQSSNTNLALFLQNPNAILALISQSPNTNLTLFYKVQILFWHPFLQNPNLFWHLFYKAQILFLATTHKTQQYFGTYLQKLKYYFGKNYYIMLIAQNYLLAKYILKSLTHGKYKLFKNISFTKFMGIMLIFP